MRFGSLSFVVGFVSCVKSSKLHSSYSCLLHSKVITTQLQIQRWTQNHNTPTDVQQTKRKTICCIEMKNWAPNIEPRTLNRMYIAQKSNWNIFTFCLCVCTSPLAKNNKITRTLHCHSDRTSHEHTIFS